jgi:hypothetical protein
LARLSVLATASAFVTASAQATPPISVENVTVEFMCCTNSNAYLH